MATHLKKQLTDANEDILVVQILCTIQLVCIKLANENLDNYRQLMT